MQSLRGILDKALYVSVICLPFSIAISPAPASVFMGFLIVAHILKKVISKEHILTKSPINIPLFVLFFLTCVSILHSINWFDTLKGGILRLLMYMLVVFSVRDGLRDKKHLTLVIIASGLGLALVTIDGIWQVGMGKDFIRGYEPVLNIGLARATASFKDSNLMGIYLSALCLLVIGPVFYYFRGKKLALALAASALGLIGVVLTYSRPALLAVYLGLIFLAFAKKDKLLFIIMIFITVISPFIIPKSVKDWAKEMEYNPLRIMCNDDRIAVYRNSLRMIKAHPFMGVGANTFMKNYKNYKEYPEYRNVVTIDYIYAHNNFLHMAGELGLLGLSIFFWFLWRLFKQGFSIYRNLKDDYLEVVCISLLACILAFLVNGLTESSLYYSRVAVLFWYLTGLVLALEKFQMRCAPRACTGRGSNERA